MKKIKLTFLALGDSYTIGEGVSFNKNFPNQTAALLRKKGMEMADPVVIAKTGWTTDELEEAISKTALNNSFDIVTLLIGVNNQYRGRSVIEYETQFESLLKKAIAFAGNKTEKVFIISIPDWGATPFAAEKDTAKIAAEINAFNHINKKLAEKYNTSYIDITPWTREASKDRSLLTDDLLHPSSKEYERWAEKLCEMIERKINGNII